MFPAVPLEDIISPGAGVIGSCVQGAKLRSSGRVGSEILLSILCSSVLQCLWLFCYFIFPTLLLQWFPDSIGFSICVALRLTGLFKMSFRVLW